MARKSTETRLRIILTARNLFSTHGFTGTALEDILNGSGITKGAFYHYFKSKEQLCRVLLDEAMAAIQQQAAALSQMNSDNQTRSWTENLSDPNKELRHHLKMVLRLTGDLSTLGPAQTGQIRRFWTEALALFEMLAQPSHSAPAPAGDPQVPAAMALCIWSGAEWLAQSGCLQTEPNILLEALLDRFMMSDSDRLI